MTLSNNRLVLALFLLVIGSTGISVAAREPTILESMGTDLRSLIWDPVRLEFRRPMIPVSQVAPVQPLDPTPPATGTPSSSVEPFQPREVERLSGTTGFATREWEPPTPGIGSISQVIGGDSIRLNAPIDTVTALQQSSSANNLTSQQRSPISLDPHIRGYRVGQIYTQADGAAFFPVRADLDTVLSKIDPSLIQNTVIVPGPYGLRYGPGLAFIDVQTISTPRYNDGFETHGRTGMDYRANGQQIYGRETIWGGNSDWGYIFSYGNRTGNDYFSGNGTRIPASYHVQNFSLQLGFDLSPDSNIEYRLARLDQTNTEYAAQIFDLNFLATDVVTVNYNNSNPLVGDHNRADAWWNNSRFGGDTTNASKQTFGPINRIDASLQALGGAFATARLIGNTSGDYMSSGVRDVVSFGNAQEGEMQLDVGTDVRYMTQSTIENFQIVNAGGANVVPPFFTNQPQSYMTDVGGYMEMQLPWLPYFRSSMGYRIDGVHTNAQASELRDFLGLAGSPFSLSQNDTLHALYLQNELDITDVWTARAAIGHAQRAPTLTERYADGIFLGIIQSGLSRVIGDPNLLKERAYQIDVGLKADYDIARGELNFFYSWVHDYITYRAQVFNDPTGARLLTAMNTPLATLAGFGYRGEADFTQQATGFLNMAYVQGADVTLGQPLPQISPFDSRVGLRYKSFDNGETWGFEGGARIVATQTRLGTVRQGAGVVALEQITRSFTTCYIQGYWNQTRNLHWVGGVQNLFDANYLEHLSLRLPAQAVGGFPPTNVFLPGIQPYLGLEWTF